MGCHSLLQGIFPTQRLNLGLLHCRWILYQLRHQGSLQTSKNGITLRTRQGRIEGIFDNWMGTETLEKAGISHDLSTFSPYKIFATVVNFHFF